MIEVSAGIIRDAENRILVCKRGPGRRNAHLWEFPGGKRETGEDAATCLVRELNEELALPIYDIRECETAKEGGIRFTFLTGRTEAKPIPTEHEDVRFLHARELLSLAFCPADTPIAYRLAMNEPPLTDFFWDFDGTLFDTYPVLTEVFAKACALQRANISAKQALDWMKITMTDAVQIASEQLGLDKERLLQDFRDIEAEITADTLPLMPEIDDTLRSLAEACCRHYLVTHRDHSALDALNAKNLLYLFTGWVIRENGFPRKPDPASLRYLMKKYEVNPEQACMIGDRPLDVQAGRNAGIMGCLLDPENRFTNIDCDLRASSAEKLLEILKPKPNKPL